MPKKTAPKPFQCPHCGSENIRFAASTVFDAVGYPPQNGRPARMDEDRASVDYDVISCAECLEDLVVPEWFDELVRKKMEKQDAEAKVRITAYAFPRLRLRLRV